MQTSVDNALPFYKSYFLERQVRIDEIEQLTEHDLHMLNVETLSALNEARHEYDLIEQKDRNGYEAGQVFRRLKIAGYFQAAIALEKDHRDS